MTSLRWSLRGILSLSMLLGSLLWATGARAAPGFGVAVYDSDNNLRHTYWPEGESVIMGGGEQDDLVAPGLEAHYAEFIYSDQELAVVPMRGPVYLSGVAVTDPTIFSPQDEVRVGGYRLQFYLPVDPAAEAEAEYDDEDDPLDDPPSPERLRAGVEATKTELGKPAYRFCHDPKFKERGVVGTDFCVIADPEAIEVCPGLAHCAQWTEAPNRWSSGRLGKGAQPGRVVHRRQLFDLPKLPAGLGYVAIALLVGLVVFAFSRGLFKAGWQDEGLDEELGRVSDEARRLQALPEARAQALLRMAQRALSERGDVHEAAILVHLAILRHLDDEGLARYHPSKTNGDYLRAIRKHQGLADLFKMVVRETERIRFGDGQADTEAVQLALQTALEVLPNTRGRPAGPAVNPALGLLLLGAMSAQACGPAPGTQAYYNHAPTGMSALLPLLRATGLRVQVHKERLTDLPTDTRVIVLRTSALGAGVWPKGFKLDTQLDLGRDVILIDDLAKSGVMLPSTSSVSAGPEPVATQLALDIDPQQLSCAFRLRGMTESLREHPVRLPQGRLILWDGTTETTTISQHALVMRPFLRDAGRTEIEGRTAAHALACHRVAREDVLPGCLFIFADRDLFTNISLTRPSNATFVAELFATLAPEHGLVVFVDRLDQWATSDSDSPFGGNDGDGASPGEALKASNMLPFVLQALVALGLLYIFLGAAFGPLRDVTPQTHKAFVEHVEAIGRQYHRTGKAGLTHSAVSLARYVVMRNRDRLRGGDAGGWAALAQELAEKHDLPPQDVRAALRLGIEGRSELGAPQADDPEPSSPRMLQTLTRLLSTHRRKPAAERGQGPNAPTNPE